MHRVVETVKRKEKSLNNNYYERNKVELNRKSKQRYYKRMKIAQLRNVSGIALQVHLLSQKTKQYL